MIPWTPPVALRDVGAGDPMPGSPAERSAGRRSGLGETRSKDLEDVWSEG